MLVFVSLYCEAVLEEEVPVGVFAVAEIELVVGGKAIEF